MDEIIVHIAVITLILYIPVTIKKNETITELHQFQNLFRGKKQNKILFCLILSGFGP